ncbi:MAG: hypothetical protein NVV82_17770 [Sporocytophaga sp.]|nr:hypothetical protein [Sporocytophaga sp.]
MKFKDYFAFGSLFGYFFRKKRSEPSEEFQLKSNACYQQAGNADVPHLCDYNYLQSFIQVVH